MMCRTRLVPWLALIAILTIIMAGFGGLALIDLSYNEIRIGGTDLCNGFWCTSAEILFHAALYAVYGALGLLSLAFLAILWTYGE